MAVVEGGGGVVTESREAKKPRGTSSAPAPGTTRLQQYTAAPAPVPTAGAALGGSAAVPYTIPESASSTAPGARAGIPSETPETVERYGVEITMPQPATATDPEAGTREALKVDLGKEKEYRARVSKEMSWDDYLGLSDQQRAAVDFNTALIQARQKDLRKDYTPTQQQAMNYDRAVERMFGEEGTSETYAPEVVGLLNQVGFKQSDAKRFDDLDDFLGLASAISTRDIEKMGALENPISQREWRVGSGAQAVGNAAQDVTGDMGMGTPTGQSTVQGIVAGVDRMKQQMGVASAVLQNWKGLAAGARNSELQYLGGTANKIPAPDIRLGGGLDGSYFESAYEALANATVDPGVLNAIKKDLGGDFDAFVKYADAKSAYSAANDVNLGAVATTQYRTVEEFRKILGLKGGGSDATR